MRYTEENRGVIQNQTNFHQKVLFEGVRFGKCMPTDIDAAMEFGGKTLILYELKHGNAEVPQGQMLLLTRIIDAWAKDGRQAVLFVCRHRTESGEDILLRNALVTEVYYNKRMTKVRQPKTAWKQTQDFLRFAQTFE